MITRGGPEVRHARGLNRRLDRELRDSGDYGVVVKNNRDELVDLAARASKRSPHYDGKTHFGAATLALTESDAHGQYFILEPTNNRSEKQGDPKSCAEMGSDAIMGWHYKRLGGSLVVLTVVVYGISDPERIRSITGTDEFLQCTPCHDCLGRYACNPAFQYDTEVITANEYGDTSYMLGDLIDRAALVGRPATSGEQQNRQYGNVDTLSLAGTARGTLSEPMMPTDPSTILVRQ